MQDIHISNGYIQLWATYLRQQNIELLNAEFLQNYKTQLIQLIDQPFETQVPLQLLNQIILATQDHLKRPQLILDIVTVIRPEHFGVLGYMASKSNDLSEIIGYVMRFQRLVIDGNEFVPLQLKQSSTGIELSWSFLDEKYNLLNELTMAAMLQLARSILENNELLLKQVNFVHQPKIAMHHLQKFFATDIVFSQNHYGFSIDLQGLNLKSEHADPMLLQLLLQQAEQTIAAKPIMESTAQRAQVRIVKHLRSEQHGIKIEQLADELHLSMRTLQRHLNDERTSFKKLLECERMKRCELLLQTELSLIDIAQQLGYSDQSALARAYKTATGQTLLTRRKQIKHA